LTEVLKQPGVKKAEIADRKLEQAFKAKGKMTKEEAQQVLADNPPPKLKEKVYDEASAIDENVLREMVSQEMFGKPYSQIDFGSAQHRKISDEVYKRMDADNGTTHGVYRLPDGENYREILLKLPSERPYAGNYSDPAKYDADLRAYSASGKSDYQSSHFKDDANVLAHMRVQDRKGPNGEKILHVEEIQSDWHQAGRKKGYGPKLEEQYRAYYTTPDGQQVDIGFGKTPKEVERMTQAAGWDTMPIKIETEKTVRQIGQGVPDAPFKKNWHELAMKRLLNYAADNGYDSIAITPGAEQAKRYDLSKHVDAVIWERDLDGRITFTPEKDGMALTGPRTVGQGELADHLGKEVAEKILRDEETSGALGGVDLQVGGEGMKGFYDKMLPDYLNNFGKQYGAQVQSTTFDVPVPSIDPRTKITTTYPIHNFPITPEMRESIKQKGLPLYQQVGIPTAGAASQMLEPEEEAGLAGGGSVAKLAALAKLKKMREEMAPRAAVVKDLMAKDSGSYLRDVTPDVLTKDYIEQEIQRMAARAEASKPEVKEAKGGEVRMTKNRDAMFMELSNKKLKRK
jgi:hypothetical protein